MKSSLFSNFIFIIFLCLSTSALAQKVEKFVGQAHSKSFSYTEKHTANYDKDGHIVSATTDYIDANGKVIATLSSQFEKSLTAPEHFFEDLRFKSKHGIRYTKTGDLELYSQDDGKKEEAKIIPPNKDQDGLVVGCQGLAYYLKDHLDQIREKKKIPIQFLIPGKLDSYNFELKFISEKENIASLEIEIKSWLLRIFAPKLEIQWDIKNKRILTYKGLSNLFDDRKKELSVDIDYIYEGL